MAAKTASKSRKKSAAVDLPIPQSIDEAASYIAEIGRCRRSIEAFERSLNERQTAIAEDIARQSKPFRDRAELLFAGLKMWAEVNRKSLCPDGSKTKRLPTGSLLWRMTPPKVTLKDVEAILCALQEKGLVEFIRTKAEVDKDAILANPAGVKAIPGISIGRREEFIVEPHEVELDMPVTKASVGQEEVTL